MSLNESFLKFLGVCDVFLKDKGARSEHCQTEEHLTKFNKAEEERLKEESQKEAEGEGKTEELAENNEGKDVEESGANEETEEKEEESDAVANGQEIDESEGQGEAAVEEEAAATETPETGS